MEMVHFCLFHAYVINVILIHSRGHWDFSFAFIMLRVQSEVCRCKRERPISGPFHPLRQHSANDIKDAPHIFSRCPHIFPANNTKDVLHIFSRAGPMVIARRTSPFFKWSIKMIWVLKTFAKKSNLLGVIHILRNHFWGSRQTPPPLCNL